MKTNKLLLTATALFAALAFSLTGCKKDDSSLKLSNNYISLAPGATYTVTVTSGGIDVTASATWATANSEVATISGGVITAVAEGSTTFTATYNGSSVTGDVIVAEEMPAAPNVEAATDAITLVVCIPAGSDCYGAPQWAGENTGWSGAGNLFTAIEGYDRWYKMDFESGVTLNGKVLATPESGEGTENSWATQWGEYEVLESYTTATWNQGDNFEVSTNGVVYIWIKSWRSNPCVEDTEYTMTLVLPECTPSDATQVYVIGSFPASNWANVVPFPIEDGKAVVTLTGQSANTWKVRLSESDYSQQGVYCSETGEVTAYADFVISNTSGKEITIDGWGDTNNALEGCLTDCVPVETAE